MKARVLQSLLCAAISVACVHTVQAQAQETKIGFVSTERIFREATPAKNAEAKIEQ